MKSNFVIACFVNWRKEKYGWREVYIDAVFGDGLNLNDDVCDKNEWTVDFIKARTDRMVKEIISMFAL